MKTKGLLLLCAGLLLSQPALAEEKAAKEGFESYSLGEVYIKGEKPSAAKETTVTNEITAEDITAHNSKTVPEALSFTPGVRVSVGKKNEPNIAIRGLDQSRVLVMIDGVPYYNTFYGSLDLNQFTTENIAKIEVTKGAASVLYGANAMAGVVNIITKQASGKPYFEFNGEVGEADTYRGSFTHGMKIGMFNYWINYSHDQSRGFNLPHDFQEGYYQANIKRETLTRVGNTAQYRYRTQNSSFIGIIQPEGLRAQSDYVRDSVWAKFGIEPAPGSEYSLSFRYIAREKGIPMPTHAIPSYLSDSGISFLRPYWTWTRYPKYDDLAIDLNGQQKVTDWLTLKAKAYYHNHADDFQSFSDPYFNYPVATSSYREYVMGGSLISEFKPVTWNTTRLVASYRGESHKQRDDYYQPFENFFSFTGSAGIENEFTYVKNLSVVAGLSYDWTYITDALKNQLYSYTNSQQFVPTFYNLPGNVRYQYMTIKPGAKDSWNPMGGITYTLPDSTKLFGSIARKTRFPTLFNLYTSKGGNPTLNPESAVNSTIGVSRPFGKWAYGELALFYNNISNMIARNSSDRNAPLVNLSKIRIYGVEINGEIYPAKDLVIKAGYNYNNASNQSTGVEYLIDGHRVPSVPEHQINVSAQYTVPDVGVKIDLSGSYMSRIYTQVPTFGSPTSYPENTGGFFVMNLRLSRKFFKHYEAYLAVNNIADKFYATDSNQYPAPGRTFFGGITARF